MGRSQRSKRLATARFPLRCSTFACEHRHGGNGYPSYGRVKVGVDAGGEVVVDAANCRCGGFQIVKFAKVAADVAPGSHVITLTL